MAEHCPTCGAVVGVVNGDEGTSHYVPAENVTALIVEERDRMAEALRRCLRDRREADKVYLYCVDALGPNEATNVLGGMTLSEQRAARHRDFPGITGGPVSDVASPRKRGSA